MKKKKNRWQWLTSNNDIKRAVGNVYRRVYKDKMNCCCADSKRLPWVVRLKMLYLVFWSQIVGGGWGRPLNNNFSNVDRYLTSYGGYTAFYLWWNIIFLLLSFITYMKRFKWYWNDLFLWHGFFFFVCLLFIVDFFYKLLSAISSKPSL